MWPPCHGTLRHSFLHARPFDASALFLNARLLACVHKHTQLAFLTLSDFFSIGTSATADGGPAPSKAFSSIQRGLRVAPVGQSS